MSLKWVKSVDRPPSWNAIVPGVGQIFVTPRGKKWKINGWLIAKPRQVPLVLYGKYDTPEAAMAAVEEWEATARCG
jgi:hypothetical protein